MDAFTFLRDYTPLFAGVSESHLETLAGASALQVWKNGQTVLFQGITVDSLSVLCTGRLSVMVKLPGKGLTPVAELNPGDVFGETSIFEMGTAGATIKAVEDDTCVLVIPQDAFRRLLAEDPAFVERVKALIASRRPPPKAPAS
ncbi:MAG: cyclic nucleotide-binding domain-containing protein [Elusimicrobiota bacterium]|nr:cyclic nucleotide-binding domain-containing protein [Elusimicrobiota bacterium]